MHIIRNYFILLCAVLLSACGGAKQAMVTLETELGTIEIAVYTQRAPISSADFLYYVDNNLYDGEGFYRAVRPETDPLNQSMELIQGGLLAMESVTASIEHETTAVTGLSHTDGAISIARDAPGSGSAAYFFITIGDNNFLDHGGKRNPDGQGYAVFGQVVKGMDVVRAIQMRDTASKSGDPLTKGQFLTNPIKIVSAKRL